MQMTELLPLNIYPYILIIFFCLTLWHCRKKSIKPKGAVRKVWVKWLSSSAMCRGPQWAVISARGPGGWYNKRKKIRNENMTIPYESFI